MSTTLTGLYSGIITSGVTLAVEASTIEAGATITSPGYGAVVEGRYGTMFSVLNLGSIEGTANETGISLSQGLVTNGIGGFIEGSVGVYIGSGTLVDAGTIAAVGPGGVAVSFGSGAADALTLTKSGVIDGGIAGFVGGDSIDLAGLTATSESFSAGTLTLFDHGRSVASLSLVGGFNTSEFGLSSDGLGGTDITLGAETLTGTYTGSFSLTALDTTITTNALFSLTTGGITSTAEHPVTVVNQGSVVTNGLFGSAIEVFDGAVTNAVSGVIDITGGAGFGVDVLKGSLVNAGTISQSVKQGTGAYLLSGELINEASGVILGPTGAGVNNGTIVNFGLISGSASDGIGIYIGLNQTVSQITNAVGGIIQGSLGVELTRGTLINAGMIRSTAPTGGVAVQFGIFNDILVVEQGSSIIGNIAGMIAGNTIDIAGETITKSHFAGGVLTLSNKGGIVDTIALAGNLNSSEFTLSSDGIGGTDVTIGTEIVTGHYGAGFTLSALNTTIDASARISNTAGYALYGSAARKWTVLNQGVVNGHASDGMVIGTGGTIVNAAGGSITGKVGVQLSSGTLVNDGVIAGTKGYGVYIGSGALTNAASGTISGLYGVSIGSGSVTNDGKIESNTAGKGFGAVVQNATLVNETGGVISGYIGAYANNATIINAGLIEGTSGIGIALGTSANTIVIDPGSGITGGIAGFAASDTLDFAETKLDGATFGNGTLTLSDHGVVAATYAMIGQFTAGEFALSSDGHGGTQVTLGTATAIGAYSGFTLTAIDTTFAGSATVVSASTVAAVFGSSRSDWTVVNAGVLVDTATGDGVKLAGAGTLTNRVGGYVAGYNGAYVSTGLIDNAGTMAGAFNGAEAIFGTIDNKAHGTITGFFGAYVYNGTITNAGTIASSRGASGTAAVVGAFRGTIIDDPGAVFIGKVAGGTNTAGVSLLELGMGATEGTLSGYGTQFINFRTLEVASGATWDIAGDTTIAGTLVNNGTIIETAADTLNITGAIEGTGTILFDPTTGIFNGPVGAGQVIDFSGAGSTIVLGDPAQFAGTLSGFTAGDVLSLPSLSGLTGEMFQNGTLTLTGSFGAIDLATTKSPGLANAVIVNTPSGPELQDHCFGAGTRIATARGAVAVEALRVGDLAQLADGGFAPVIWLGKRTVHPARHPRPDAVNPVVIAAGALADGVPARTLTLSPDHALLLDGVLIPAKTLVNGSTIRQIAVETITYYHVELPAHAALLAEGTPAESYLASGSRAQFETGGGAMTLHPDFAQAMREAAGFAPFAETGPLVEAVRARLLARADVRLTTDAALRVEATADGALILSRQFVPAEISADPRDRRRLGVKIASLTIDGRDVKLDHPALRAGWHDLEPDGRWTDGAALIPAALLGGATVGGVVVTLACDAAYRIAA